MNWTTYDYSPAPCLPCCVVVTPCFLTMPTLLIDGTTTNYADSTAAAAAISDQASPGCYFEALPISVFSRPIYSASYSSGVLSCECEVFAPSGSTPGSNASTRVVCRLYLTVSGGLTVVWTSSGSGAGTPIINSGGISLYLDDGVTLVDNQSAANPGSGTFTPSIPADGYYYLVGGSGYAAIDMFGDADADINMSSITGGNMVPCTIRAAYDDGSGGTAYVLCA